MEAYQRERGVSCIFGKEKEENECVKKKNSYVWKGVVHGKDVCKQEHGKKLCVTSICSGVHGRISTTSLWILI